MRLYLYSAILFITFLSAQGAAQTGSEQMATIISPQVACLLLELNRNNPAIVILDVRTPKEYQEAGHIRNSMLLDYRSPEFNMTLDSLDRSKIYLVHCAIGIRSGRTFRLMKSLGFRRVFDIAGGIVRWEKEGLPVER